MKIERYTQHTCFLNTFMQEKGEKRNQNPGRKHIEKKGLIKLHIHL
jgi:hypothetical protein